MTTEGAYLILALVSGGAIWLIIWAMTRKGGGDG